jgi:hypothetical protein
MMIPSIEDDDGGIVVVTGEETKTLTCAARGGSACWQSRRLPPNKNFLKKAELVKD